MDYQRYLQEALAEAKLGPAEGCTPVGSLVVAPDGTIIGRGRNRVQSSGDMTSHAEVDAIRNAGRKLLEEPYKGTCTLFTTVEPCMMCTGAACWSGIKTVVWAVRGRGGGAADVLSSNLVEHVWIGSLTCVAEPSPAMKLASVALMVDFFRKQGNEDQAAKWAALA